MQTRHSIKKLYDLVNEVRNIYYDETLPNDVYLTRLVTTLSDIIFVAKQLHSEIYNNDYLKMMGDKKLTEEQ